MKYNSLKPFLITSATLDYSATSSELIFNATTSSQVVEIVILEDAILESSETIHVTLTSVDPAAILNPASAVITIGDNDGKLYLHMLICCDVTLRDMFTEEIGAGTS